MWCAIFPVPHPGETFDPTDRFRPAMHAAAASLYAIRFSVAKSLKTPEYPLIAGAKASSALTIVARRPAGNNLKAEPVNPGLATTEACKFSHSESFCKSSSLYRSMSFLRLAASHVFLKGTDGSALRNRTWVAANWSLLD